MVILPCGKRPKDIGSRISYDGLFELDKFVKHAENCIPCKAVLRQMKFMLNSWKDTGLVTLREASQLSGMSVQRLMGYIKSGKLKAKKYEGVNFIYWASLQSLVLMLQRPS